MTTPALDASTVKLLLDTGERLKAQTLVEFPNDNEKRILLADGKHTIIDTPRRPERREHEVKTIDDFVSAYNELIKGESEPAGEKMPRPTPSPIWFSQRGVEIYIDDRFRDEWIRLALPTSRQLGILSGFDQSPRQFTQPDLVRLLRHDLAGCVALEVLAAFRTLSWQSIRNTRAVIEQNKQSMDADVQQQISQAVPDSFMVAVPLFDHADFRDVRASLSVTVDLVFDQSAFRLQLLPGEHSGACAAALETIRERLAAVLPDVPAIAGQA